MKFKKLIPALCMLLVAAMLMGTSTYAWFSMNTQVTATGMQVKAVAEDGLLIKNELDTDTASNWKVSTNASYGGLVDLAPTSTADVTAWYHNKSDDQNDAKAGQLAATYETLSADTNWKRDEGTGKTVADRARLAAAAAALREHDHVHLGRVESGDRNRLLEVVAQRLGGDIVLKGHVVDGPLAFALGERHARAGGFATAGSGGNHFLGCHS